MEDQDKQQEQNEDVEAHIRAGRHLQDEEAPTDEHGRRFRSAKSGDDDDEDVEAHIRAGRQLQDEEAPSDEHGRRF